MKRNSWVVASDGEYRMSPYKGEHGSGFLFPVYIDYDAVQLRDSNLPLRGVINYRIDGGYPTFSAFIALGSLYYLLDSAVERWLSAQAPGWVIWAIPYEQHPQSARCLLAFQHEADEVAFMMSWGKLF